MKEKIGTLLKKPNYLLKFSKLHFLLKLVFKKICYREPESEPELEPEPVKIGPAPQHWPSQLGKSCVLTKPAFGPW